MGIWSNVCRDWKKWISCLNKTEIHTKVGELFGPAWMSEILNNLRELVIQQSEWLTVGLLYPSRQHLTFYKIRGKIIRTVLFCIVYSSNAIRTHEQRAVSGVDCSFGFTLCWRLLINSNSFVHILQREAGVNEPSDQHPVAFSALTLLVSCQEEHPPCTKLTDDVLAWLGLSLWSEVLMSCIWSSWCHCHPISHILFH